MGTNQLSTQATINGKEIFELLRGDLAAIEREFGRDTVSGVEAITEIGEYLRSGGGKRIRPMLLLLSAKLFNYPGRGAIKLGAVVEIIHTATLVHWPAIGSTCKPSRSPCRSATSASWTR